MRKLRFGYSVALVALMTLAFSSPASAQATRTFVSGVGDDANPCSRTAPCKTWAGAISKTAAGGEMDALDPGGFGALTITKAITLDGGGGQVASVLVSGTNGITIAAGPSDVVVLRNVRINGIYSGLDGVEIISAGQVHLENVNIFAFLDNGVEVSASATVKLSISDSTITDVTEAGVTVATTSGAADAVLTNVRIYNAAVGVGAGIGGSFTVSDSDLSFNGIGASAQVAPGGGDVVNCMIAYNTNAGVQSIAGSTVRVMSSTIRRNGIGLNPNGGNLQSDGLNNATGNLTLGSTTGPTTKI